MALHAAVSHTYRMLVAGGMALVFPVAAGALENLPPETLAVKVFSDRYVAAGKPFADVAALEMWAKPILISEVRLETCSPGSGKQLLAAVERFQEVYKEAIVIKVQSPGEPATCASAAVYAREALVDQRPDDREYLVSDASGRSIIP